MEGGGVGENSRYRVAGTHFKALLFPVSYIGLSARVTKFGIPSSINASSIGALLILWSAQETMSKIMDALDAYYL
jgi:ABC-type uncharacterized transport system permease subunit